MFSLRSSHQSTTRLNPSLISQSEGVSHGDSLTFLSEIPLEEEDEEEEEEKASNDQTSSISQVINDNAVLTRIDIRTTTRTKK